MIRTRFVFGGMVLAAFGASVSMATELVSVPSALIRIVDTVEVAASSAGVLKQVPAREGMMVVRGQVLAQIDDGAAALQAEQAVLQLKFARQEATNDIAVRLARKTHQVAAKELERARNINRKLPNSVSAAEVALKQLASDRTALELENATYQQSLAGITAEIRATELELAQQQKEKFAVLAPMNGMVVHVGKRAGEYVELGAALVRVVRVDRVRAEGFVPVRSMTRELLGRRATLRIPLGDEIQTVEGVVVFVSPEADPVSREVPVWAEFANPELTLKPGLRGTLTIYSEPATETGESIIEPVPRARSAAKQTAAAKNN